MTCPPLATGAETNSTQWRVMGSTIGPTTVAEPFWNTGLSHDASA